MNTPSDDGRLNLHDESGMTRRDLMKRGAVVGGTLLWVAPAIQTYGSKAFAQENGSAACDACVAVTTGGHTTHVVFDPTEVCCTCIDAGGGNLGAVVSCVASNDCIPEGGPPFVKQGPCPD